MSALPAPAVWQGRLALGFERRGARTVLARSAARMPLAFQRPFYPEGEAVCHVLMLHPPGGMVGGDRLEIELALGERASALASTPAAAKWYRADAIAEQDVVARVGREARLEWLPLETIVFDGARVAQRLRVELDRDAGFTGWEITRFGRSHRGEQFAHGEWRSATEIWRGDEPLWIDRQRLEGGSRLLQSAYGLAGQPVIGSLVFVGAPIGDGLINEARAAWGRLELPGESGVTRLRRGMLCRYRGPSSAAARTWFTAVWDLIRRATHGAAAHPPRVWST